MAKLDDDKNLADDELESDGAKDDGLKDGDEDEEELDNPDSWELEGDIEE